MTARIPASIVPALRALLNGQAATWPELAPAAWERAVAALDDQGVLPLVHDAIRVRREAGASIVSLSESPESPELLASAAAAAYYRTAAHNALMLHERDAVLGALAGHGILAVPLKGAALLGTAYPNIAHRPLGDLDLLVAEHDLGTTLAALEARGYAQQLSGIPALRHHLELVRTLPSGARVLVEAHRRLLASPALERALPTDAVLARAAPDERAGGPAIPCPADLLLHAAAHLVVQHAREERLIWVADIDRIVRRWYALAVSDADADAGADDREVDGAGAGWPGLLSAAESAGLSAVLGRVLAASILWFDTPMPPDARALAARSSSESAPQALARLRRHAPVGREGARVLGDARAQPSWRAGMAFALRSAFPSPAYMRDWYGVDRPALLPIYYAARLGRGLWHIAAHAARPDRERRQADEPPERWMVER